MWTTGACRCTAERRRVSSLGPQLGDHGDQPFALFTCTFVVGVKFVDMLDVFKRSVQMAELRFCNGTLVPRVWDVGSDLD